MFACFALTLDGDDIVSARIGCGGVAAVPARARRTEALLAGATFDERDHRARGGGAGGRVHAARRLPRNGRVSTHGARQPAAPAVARARGARAGACRRRDIRMNAPEPAVPLQASLIGAAIPHESAGLHVTGAAHYTDDLPEPRGTLHAALGVSPVACGALRGVDLAAVRAAPGVVDVITAADIPGVNDVGPIENDDPILAEETVEFAGQPVFAVAADERERGAPRGAARATGRSTRCPPCWTSRPRARADVDGAADRARASRRCECRARRRSAPAARHVPQRRPGPLLPRRPGGARDSRRAGRHARARLDPASGRGAADGRACARRVGARRGRRMPADGRRLRRQGNADVPVRVHRGDPRAAHRPCGEAAARPRHRHALDRQAPRVPPRLRRGIRRRRPHRRPRAHAGLALRVLGRPVRPGQRPRGLPCRQRLLAAASRHSLAALPHQHRVRHGVSRLRRSAGHVRDRAGDGRHRPRARPRPARRAQGEPVRHAESQRHAVRHDDRGQHRAGADRHARAHVALSRAARASSSRGIARARSSSAGSPSRR